MTLAPAGTGTSTTTLVAVAVPLLLTATLIWTGESGTGAAIGLNSDVERSTPGAADAGSAYGTPNNASATSTANTTRMVPQLGSPGDRGGRTSSLAPRGPRCDCRCDACDNASPTIGHDTTIESTAAARPSCTSRTPVRGTVDADAPCPQFLPPSTGRCRYLGAGIGHRCGRRVGSGRRLRHVGPSAATPTRRPPTTARAATSRSATVTRRRSSSPTSRKNRPADRRLPGEGRARNRASSTSPRSRSRPAARSRSCPITIAAGSGTTPAGDRGRPEGAGRAPCRATASRWSSPGNWFARGPDAGQRGRRHRSPRSSCCSSRSAR